MNSGPATAADGERVTFTSGGQTLVGRLYPAAFGAGPAPAVAITGPVTFVKEQAPLQYARRLARNGYRALTFDPRYRGESGGELGRGRRSGRSAPGDPAVGVGILL